ncbi:MAG: NADH:flavin oxidoreductase [Bdellovibrionales bacterium]
MSPPRFHTFRFKNGKSARNRVVVPPMASQTADTRGMVTEETLAHYVRLSQANPGILFVEYTFIDPSGKSEPNQLGAATANHVEGLSRLATAIKASGALAGLQLVHAGGKTTSDLAGGPLLGPSPIPVPVKGRESEVPIPMTHQQIEALVESFSAAAARAANAGFDIVELHAAHGYGLNQWLSPLTNQRRDAFGGSLANRSRLLQQIVKRIRHELPNILLAVRLPAQDHVPCGLEVAEMTWVAEQLEQLGVDLIDVSSGIGGWRRPSSRVGEGYLVEDAAVLKTHLSIPVIGVGGIESGNYIDSIIQKEYVDFAAVGRAILNDPSLWRKNHLSNRKEHHDILDHAVCRTEPSPGDGVRKLPSPRVEIFCQ